jgi:hypothetical protein
MFAILDQRPKTTGINGNPSIPFIKFGITFLAIFMLPLVSALIILPLEVLYKHLLIRLPLKVGLLSDLSFSEGTGNRHTGTGKTHV